MTEVDSTIVQFSRNPFAAMNPAPVDSVISSVTLRAAGEEEEMKVRNLTRPIELVIPITDPDPWRELSRFNCSGDDAAMAMCAERNLAVIARLLQPSCFYWDDAARNWTTDGCNFTGFRDDFSVGVCECSHLTSFMARFATTVEKARVVLSVAKGLNLETLKKNLGESVSLSLVFMFVNRRFALLIFITHRCWWLSGVGALSVALLQTLSSPLVGSGSCTALASYSRG